VIFCEQATVPSAFMLTIPERKKCGSIHLALIARRLLDAQLLTPASYMSRNSDS
jgi:hypothetical protein